MILIEHFLSKGFYISDPLCSQINSDSNFVVVFDTCYFINLNNSSFTDAIVSYWIAPRASGGNAWQPHKAIISDAGEEYIVSNEDFISKNFCIDSVSDNNGVIIYAYEYDSALHKEKRNLRIHLEIIFKSKPENF